MQKKTNIADETISEACIALQLGSVVAYPTESVFGIGCLATDTKALNNLRKIKHRAKHKGFIVLCASVQQLMESFPSLNINAIQEKQILEKQNHPTTWLISINKEISPLLNGDNQSIAVRITQHPIAKALCENVGPIVSTSANKEGEPPAIELAKIKESFGAQIDYYLDGHLGGVKTPSQIINLDNGEIIRSA